MQYLEWREKQYDLRYKADVFGKDSDTEPIVKGKHVHDSKASVFWWLAYVQPGMPA